MRKCKELKIKYQMKFNSKYNWNLDIVVME